MKLSVFSQEVILGRRQPGNALIYIYEYSLFVFLHNLLLSLKWGIIFIPLLWHGKCKFAFAVGLDDHMTTYAQKSLL